MPLTSIQRKIVEILRPFRTAHNYIGGGAALNRKWPRLSDDMDIFRDSEASLSERVTPELEALKNAGFSVDVAVANEFSVVATIRKQGDETKIDWTYDPDYCLRYFPAIDDDELGFRLHDADNAVNKVYCASRRNTAARDAVDLANIVRKYCPLGPLIWAAASKSEMSPLQMAGKIRRIVTGYSNEEIRTVRMEDGTSFTQNEMRGIVLPALDRAVEYIEDIAPADTVGNLFVDPTTGAPVEADDTAISEKRVDVQRVKDFSVTQKIQH